MKKVLLGGILSLLFSFSYAQINGFFLQDTRFGLKVGGNYSRVRRIHDDSKSRIGFNAGFLAETPISYEDKYFIQTEVSYSQKGEENEKGGKEQKFYMNYIDVPILFKAYLSDDESEFFGLAGPQFSFLINKKIENTLEAYKYDSYKSFDVGLVAGIGYSYKRNIELTLRGEYDFLDTTTFNESKATQIVREGKKGVVGSKESNNNVVISLGLSYIF